MTPETDAAVVRPRQRWRALARVVVTLTLLAILASRLDPVIFSLRIAAFDAGWTALAFATVGVAVALSAWKWGMILLWQGRSLSFARRVRHYFVGLFFNNVLPTTVGGDAMRAWETARDTGEVPDATSSVIAERLIAGAALGVTSVIGLPFLEVTAWLAIQVGMFLVIDLALVALFLVPRVAEKAVLALVPSRMGSWRDAVSKTIASVRRVLSNPSLVGRVALVSVLFQVLVALVNACLFFAIEVPITFAQCVVLTPMIFAVTMLPVSIAGLGVREAAYWYFFSQAGVSREEAVIVSLAFFVVVALASLPGGLFFVLGRDDHRTSTGSPHA